MRRNQPADEECGDKNLRRPAPVAQGEIIGDDGDQAFARAVDDARGDHSRGVAAKAHGHAEGLLAVRPNFLEHIIQVEGYARQVAVIFKQGEQREENCHWRQHHANDPGRRQIHAIEEQAVDPPGQADGSAKTF